MQQITVSELVRYLKRRLDTDDNIQNVLVSGEISNFHRHYSGHLYFTLKDDTSAINCVMFKSNAYSLKFEPKTGDKVIVTAKTSIFETSGQLQLYVQKISLDGLGELYAMYEQLKSKLETNGIFDDSHKKELAIEYIENVAVLVGDKSAAMSDIKTTFKRRWPLCKVAFYPVLVQGNDAPSMIIDTLKKVDKLNYDAIILARGGGSFEDLFCFNDEELLMCIYNLKTFIITGIGHEQDYTLADFVADMRAPTPTASVELITPNINDVISEVKQIENNMHNIVINKFENLKMKYDYYFNNLINYQSHLKNIELKIDNELLQIKKAFKNNIENLKLKLKRNETLLNAYSVENTLKRGYTIVMQDNELINKKKRFNDNKEFEVKFIDGSIKARRI